MRDERAILEFIVHHLSLGFDCVFVLDHLSVKPIQEQVDTLPEEHRTRVRVVRPDVMKGTKTQWIKDWVVPLCIEHCSDYFIHLDADDYIVFRDDIGSVDDLLRRVGRPDVLAFHWRQFGSGGLQKNPHPLGHLTPVFTRCQQLMHDHFKPMVSRTQFTDPRFRFVTPHDVVGRDPTYASMSGKTSRHKPVHSLFAALKEDRHPDQVQAYINHYIIQDKETYYRRKVHRVRDDNLQFRPQPKHDVLMSKYNDATCLKLRDRYDSLSFGPADEHP